MITQIIQSPLGQHHGIAVFNATTGVLEINSLHPFVAYFGDEFSDKKQNLPLELLATSEVLLEASMYEMGLKESYIREVMGKRDLLLRELARSTGKRNALMVAQDLINASSDQDKLENEVVAALDVMGFDVVPIGGAGKRDALAQARLGSARKGARPYGVSVEVIARGRPEKKPTAAQIGVTRIAKHRDDDDAQCGHALVVVADFPSDSDETATITRQLKDDSDETDRTITFILLEDFARLTRLVPARRVGLVKLQELLSTCTFPVESRRWVESIASSKPSDAPYREILESVIEEQQDLPDQAVEYTQIESRLRLRKNIVIPKDEIIAICHALYRIVPEYVYAGTNTVEVLARPDRILDALNATLKLYPDGKQLPRRKGGNGSA